MTGLTLVTSHATGCQGSNSMVPITMEDDSMPSLMAPEVQFASESERARSSIKDGVEFIVFFRPVDNNLAHHTFLGTSFHRKFDFVAQRFAVISCTKNSGTRSKTIRSVVIGRPLGPVITVKLSHVQYSSLSQKLRVWELEDSGYHVSRNMQLAQMVGELSLYFLNGNGYPLAASLYPTYDHPQLGPQPQYAYSIPIPMLMLPSHHPHPFLPLCDSFLLLFPS